jgi:hypothetical protein
LKKEPCSCFCYAACRPLAAADIANIHLRPLWSAGWGLLSNSRASPAALGNLPPPGAERSECAPVERRLTGSGCRRSRQWWLPRHSSTADRPA